jgi:hypothetical protein
METPPGTLQIENARQKSGYPGVLVDEDRDATFKTRGASVVG